MSQKLYLISHVKTEDIGVGRRMMYEHLPDYYKIGIAGDPKHRLSNMQSATPHKLELITTVECDNAKGVERELHGIYRWLKKRGEWFKPSTDLRNSLIGLDELEEDDVRAVHKSKQKGDWKAERSLYVMIHRAREGALDYE